MSATSSIEWTDRTWNPVRGCSVISPGCHNCYAMKQAHRFSWPTVSSIPHTGEVQKEGGPYEGLTKLTKAGPQWTGVVRTVPDALLEPLSWRKPQRVFVNSMSDLFHEGVPDAFIDQVFSVMSIASKHTFQILTKRPDRMLAYMSKSGRISNVAWGRAVVVLPDGYPPAAVGTMSWPLPNVWLGVSVESQQYASRLTWLLDTPAAVRFVSVEPQLGAVDLTDIEIVSAEGNRPRASLNALTGHVAGPDDILPAHLDWVIVGGESGPKSRPFDLAWARSIVQQCQAAAVPVFVKQLGAQPVNSILGPVNPMNLRTVRAIKDRKGGDISEWPADLRVREFPKETVCT